MALDRLLIGQQSILAARIRARLPRSLAPAVGVEDLLQETYTLVFRNIAAFRPVGPGAFANWVATIADNVVRDAIRAQRALKRGGGMTAQAAHPPADRSSIAPLVEVLALYERTPSRSASGREAAAAVEQALAELRPEYREALTLRFLQGLPVPEVAARMGRTESAVHKVCARGLQRLREALGDPGRFQSKG